jgi:hypothetical protein
MSVILTDIIARFGVWISVGIGCAVVFFTYDSARVNKGRVEERATIEKATSNAASQGASAARKSLSSGVRGKRDPTTRDD